MNINETIKNSDFIVSFGSFISKDKQEINDAIMQAISKQAAPFVYMHPLDDINTKLFYTQFIKYEVGSEEGIVTMLLETLVKESIPSIAAFIEDLDMGYISAESSAGEEEFEEILENSCTKESKVLLIGDDILAHDSLTNIVKMLAIIKKYSSFEVCAIDEALQVLIDTCIDESIEEIKELKSYNGTLIYNYFDDENLDSIIGSESFSRVAKIQDNDEITYMIENKEVKKRFVLDSNLQGTIALCANDINENSLSSYRYKQVKILKVPSE